MMTMDSVLFHWGILGQKWGVRRYQYQDGRLTDEGKKRYRKGKKLNEFSNEEIDSFINRASKEATLVKYLRDIKGNQMSLGEQFVSNFMQQAGKTLATDLSKNAAKHLDDSMSKRFGWKAGNSSKYTKINPGDYTSDEIKDMIKNGDIFANG